MLRPATSRFFAYAMILTLVGSLFSLVIPAVPSFASHENITVNIGDDVDNVYSPGDTVVVEGTIDDVQEDEDVSIRVMTPSGSTEEDDDVTPDEDDGYFDFTFNIPSNGDGGVWTVEVSYDGDETNTYFMVEYDTDDVDVITVNLDQSDGVYQGEDTVEVEGTIFDEVDGEDFVRIRVLDPSNDELQDKDVELDNDDFTFDFDLDDAHGRYAVLVTYDDQEGAAVLEVEDEDEGSNEEEEEELETVTEGTEDDLSAEIDDDIYAPGGTVTITGEIEDYDTGDDEDLSVSVLNPDDEEFEAEDDVDVDQDNGEFEYEFDLDENADEGLYTITVEYNNDEVELAFGVEEGGSTGSGAQELTIKLDKTSYLAGETMTVSGTVEDVADPDEGVQVSVFIYDPDSRVILEAASSKYVTPSSDGAYSATITIPSDLEEDDAYKVIVSYLGDQIEKTFSITGVSSTPADEITVETDEEEYEAGSTVEISGEVPSSSITEGQQLLIRVNKPDGNPCRIDPISVPSSGSYSYSVVLGGVCGVAGEYDVEVTYGDLEGTTSFEVIGSSVSSYTLDVEGDTFPIGYEIDSGSINTMFVRPNEDKLVITLSAEEDGQLTVTLPREVIDAIEEGEDIDYTVTIEDEEGNVQIIQPEETENTDDERTLVIDYDAGTDRIEIIGTQVVPEFGAIAAIVMAVAIVGMIVATTRYGKLNFFRQ